MTKVSIIGEEVLVTWPDGIVTHGAIKTIDGEVRLVAVKEHVTVNVDRLRDFLYEKVLGGESCSDRVWRTRD